MGMLDRSIAVLRAPSAVLAVAAICLAGPALATAGHGSAAVCAGTDILSELAELDPEAHARVMRVADATENTEALLWRLRRDGHRDSYLFGTMHVTDERVTHFSPELTRVLEVVDRVALEIDDLSPDAMVPVIKKASELLLFTDGSRLDTLLSVSEYNKTKAILAKIGVPQKAASLIKPWFVSALLGISDCERNRSKTGDVVLDMKLAATARERGAEVVGLETLESQLLGLASVPLEEQIFSLRAGLAFSERSHDLLETTLQLYQKRRIGAALQLHRELARWAGIENASFDGFERELLEKRNRIMAERALPLLEQGNTLIAVGALHLVGANGLVALLREAGYAVTPIE